MKRRAYRQYQTGIAPPRKALSPVKGDLFCQDELYYVAKKHIASNRPVGLRPIGRFLSFPAAHIRPQKYFSQKRRLAGSSFNANRLMSGKGVPHRKIPPQKGGE